MGLYQGKAQRRTGERTNCALRLSCPYRSLPIAERNNKANRNCRGKNGGDNNLPHEAETSRTGWKSAPRLCWIDLTLRVSQDFQAKEHEKSSRSDPCELEFRVQE
jgi:hypothetical protein